jgi:predicted alpha/beta-hydrolase family hydrolase
MTSTAQSEAPLEGVKGLVFFSFPLHPPGRPGTERAEHLFNIDLPMLFLTGTRDEFATDGLLEGVVENLGKRVTLHLLDTADHSFKILKRTRQSTEDVFDEMARVTSVWATGLGRTHNSGGR